MKLGNLFLVWLGAIVAWFVVALLGWGVAFAFGYEVFVPWLGCVPEQYHRLAAFASAFVFDGAGAFLVLFVLALLGLGVYKLRKRRQA